MVGRVTFGSQNTVPECVNRLSLELKYTATEFTCHRKPGVGQWHWEHVWEAYFFLLILCFTSTQLSDGFFLISYWAKGAGRSFEAHPLRSYLCCLVVGLKQIVLEVMAI